MLNASRNTGSHYYRGYSAAAVSCDATPHRLISMLYDGLLVRLGNARNAIEQGDVQAKLRSVDSAMSIISYLRSILDHDVGGVLSLRLGKLYDYMLRRLLRANTDNDAVAISEVMNLLTTVKSGWEAIQPVPGETVAS